MGSRKPRGRKVATYLYTDLKGNPKIKKIRYESKQFPTYFACGQDPESGLWLWTSRKRFEHWSFWIEALYKLPEVVAALRVDVPVWWCEGEKDADNLAAVKGLVTTTTPNPSELWDDQARWFTKFETQSEVIVVCDQDEHGGWWGWERYTALIRVGVDPSRITVVTPRSRRHKDVSDVLGAGLGVGALRSVDLDRLRACATQYAASRRTAYVRSAPTPAPTAG